MSLRLRWARGAGVTMIAGLSLVAAACGSGGESTAAESAGDGKLPAEIKLVGVRDTTGPVAYAGLGAVKGTQLAVEEINNSNFLGEGVKITITEKDSANSIETASSEVTSAIADSGVAAILGPAAGQQAAAVAPVAERSKTPIVFTQAGSDGVVIGKYTFRATSPMDTYYHLATEYLAAKGLKNVTVLYNATFPTFAQLAEKTMPDLAGKSGLTVVSSTAVQATTQDFTSPTRLIAEKKPDAALFFLTAPQSVTALKQLRQAGYDGPVLGTSVQGGGNLKSAGEYGKGVIYPTDFSPAQSQGKSAEFIKNFQAKFNALPDQYAAEGYDAAWWIARAIKASGSATRDGIQQGLAKVAAEGFEGAMGQLGFEGNDMRVPGVLVEWDGEAEKVVTTTP